MVIRFHLLTQRDVAMTKSRTITITGSSYSLKNAIIMNSIDAKKLRSEEWRQSQGDLCNEPGRHLGPEKRNQRNHDWKSKSNRDHHAGSGDLLAWLGHWATGAADVAIDGKVIKGDPRRASGIHANAAMWIDPYLKNTCMLDPVGGSVSSFYDPRSD